MKTFDLSELILRAVSEKGYLTATPVQKMAIPVAMEGHDALVSAQTGTGKTASFVLPMLHRLQAKSKGARGPRTVRAIILTPTRELAAQVGESVRTYGKYLPLRSTIVYGGVAFGPQMKSLRNGVDVLIATPGRLLDHVSQGTVDLSKVEIFVLDEADRMLDMGFINDIRKILSMLSKDRQGLMFSATFSDAIKKLADSFLRSPKIIEVARQKVEPISQLIYPVDNRRKRELLVHLIRSKNLKQVLVFTRTKHGADRLAEQLETDGIRATAIHGNKSQNARMRALADFKKGFVQVLVATDVAARGLDIDQLPHVINFELPQVAEDYVHRIGRTGRAGNVGEALSLVCVDEQQLLRNIERLQKLTLPREVVPGFEPDPSIRPQPIRRGGGGGGGGGRFSRGGPPRGRFQQSRARY